MSEAPVTPIRRQYLELKRQYPGCILFFRLGDFYETFDADAELIARELDVVLTSRPVAKDVRVPMAGVPHHAAESYIARLLERGYRVAIAEQIGSEAINGLVPREVRRVMTPGTVMEDSLLNPSRPSYLAAMCTVGERFGLAYCDITTGEFCATQLDDAASLERELTRLQPRELLVSEQEVGRWREGLAAGVPRTPLPAWRLEPGYARQTLLDAFRVSTLQGFGLEDKPAALSAAGAILTYLRETQPAALAQLTAIQVYSSANFMALDANAQRTLELVEPLRRSERKGGPPPTLLGVLDHTLTPMGARTLRAWLTQPLLDLAAIEARLDRVAALYNDALLRAQVREQLKHLPDLERLTSRAVSDIATPRDLLNLRQACERYLALVNVLPQPAAEQFEMREPPRALPSIAELIASAIHDAPDAESVIRPGFSAELDELRAATQDAKTWIANLERAERERTGIRSLKVGYNKVFGYYIEVTHANRDMVPDDYIRKQTLANAERYITPQLKEYETLILNAGERIAEVERRLLAEVTRAVAAHAKELYAAAHRIARLDVAAALAEVAARNRYTRPRFNHEGYIRIRDGRHPVIEHLLNEAPFTPNDTELDADARILIITGPNMSGKSSYMRQVALIVLMAQMGSFVPAREADLC
ncbi:MAG: DNA mismatch repair protein MutS, partial [Thermoflexales bacterium]